MTTEKMVYVKSNDYWGYDASEFDNDANFYTYTWTVPESMYNAMDADNNGIVTDTILLKELQIITIS